ETLRQFAPSAHASDWNTMIAGQRVQVIRRGALEFDTTVLSTADGSIAGLLGASPGASTAVSDMFDVLARCFPHRYPSWLPTLKEMVPSLDTELSHQPALFEEVWSWGTKVLRLDPNSDPDKHE
ncbi:MAG: malate:quinone oxidoreductase, partial [Mycobacterium sp.]